MVCERAQREQMINSSAGRTKLDVDTLGQVFTPDALVQTMLALRTNTGRVLEPAAGNGAFSRCLPGCVAIEKDGHVAPAEAKVMDFFAYPLSQRFDTIIGNPPYVRFQDIAPSTRKLLDTTLFDARSNLFLFFIEKCVHHLNEGGELIFITPREFIKLTAATRLNNCLFEQGTISHWIETGDTRIFCGALPNCAIFRFVKGDFSRRTLYRRLDQAEWDERRMVHISGQLAFTHARLSVPLAELFDVRVGAVSGADAIFEHPQGNLSFVCSHTATTGQLRRMLYNIPHPDLEAHKPQLLARRVARFDERNWWAWGRGYHAVAGPRIYVNGKTRQPSPFFTHACEAYDGSVLALFPRVPLDIDRTLNLLNTAVPWEELGFIVDGRFCFTQRTLATLWLPEVFAELLPHEKRPNA